MIWPVRALLGPMFWAAAFSAIYAVHGLGCALDWPARPALIGDLHHFTLISLWLTSLLGALLILWSIPKTGGRTGGRIVRAGDWIGFLAILLTLFPVLGVTSCG